MQVIRLDLEKGGFFCVSKRKKTKISRLDRRGTSSSSFFFREMMCQNGLRRIRTMSMLEVANTFLTPADL